LDYEADVIIGGTPKGKRQKGKGKNKTHLFYELFKKTQDNRHKTKDYWQSFQYSTYDNDLLQTDEIKNLEKEMDRNLARQEIYGEFIDSELDSIIKREWWIFYDRVELHTKINLGIFQSWDTAFKTNEENDYTVCTTWQITEDGYYLLDLWRGRVEFPELKRKVIEKGKQFRITEILIEDHASGQSLIQELNRNTRLPIKPIKKDKDKMSYVYAVTPLIESGKVRLPTGSSDNNNIEDFINECEDFPNGEFDDIVDSMTQFLNYAKNLILGRTEILSRKVRRRKYY
jgi:predicted phage terminase large subunit-like protein